MDQVLRSTPLDMYYYNATITCGDVNLDGNITITDAVLLNKILVGTVYNQAQLKNADANQDGEVNIIDTLLILKNIVGTYSKLPHDTSKENWIYSKILNAGSDIENATTSFEARNTWICGTPIDIGFIGPEDVTESDISVLAKTGKDQTEYVTLAKGEDYDVVNGMYTMKLSSTELRKKYGIVEKTTAICIKYKDKVITICRNFIDSIDSNVVGDFSGDGLVNYEDSIIYGKYYTGEYDLTKYSYTKKKLEEFKAYVQQQGYDSSDEKACMYVLRKLGL